jgi:hypothetical protein
MSKLEEGGLILADNHFANVVFDWCFVQIFKKMPKLNPKQAAALALAREKALIEIRELMAAKAEADKAAAVAEASRIIDEEKADIDAVEQRTKRTRAQEKELADLEDTPRRSGSGIEGAGTPLSSDGKTAPSGIPPPSFSTASLVRPTLQGGSEPFSLQGVYSLPAFSQCKVSSLEKSTSGTPAEDTRKTVLEGGNSALGGLSSSEVETCLVDVNVCLADVVSAEILVAVGHGVDEPVTGGSTFSSMLLPLEVERSLDVTAHCVFSVLPAMNPPGVPGSPNTRQSPSVENDVTLVDQAQDFPAGTKRSAAGEAGDRIVVSECDNGADSTVIDGVMGAEIC